jgi:hypothetical protein
MTLRKAGLLLLILSLGMCNQAVMVAPPGSNFAGQLVANPPFIAAHGDVSVISGLLLDPTGQPVADGTVVQFFTTLGRIEEQGKTNDGVVRVNLVSDSRSGTADVTAFSGAGSGTSPTTSTTVAAAPGTGLSAFSVSGPSIVAGVQATATTQVTIGSARPASVLVSADPPRLTTGRASTILAQVFDEFGNPVANVPVIFQITAGATLARLDSGGRPIFTDNSGRASDTLRTNSLAGGTVEVTATVPGAAVPGSVTVPVNTVTPVPSPSPSSATIDR